MTVGPIDPTEIREGMQIIGSDGTQVGTVKLVREADLLVERRMARDIYLSFGFIRYIDGPRIVLTIPADEALDKGVSPTL